MNPTNPFYRFGKGPSSPNWSKVPFALTQTRMTPPPGTSYAPGSITPQYQVPQPIGDMRGRNWLDRSQYGRDFERDRNANTILEKLLAKLRDTSFGGASDPASVADLIQEILGSGRGRGGNGRGNSGGSNGGGGNNGGGNRFGQDQNT